MQLNDQVHVYPDMMFTCHEEDLADERLVRQPSLVAEVLSDCTEKRDRGEKFEAYLTLNSLRYYLLLSQSKVQIELFTKLEKGWHSQRLEDPAEKISLPEWGISFMLGDLFGNEFE